MNEASEKAETQDRTADLTERAIEVLRTVYDPEIPANIYDLGLVYNVEVKNTEAVKADLLIEMTLTTVNCPMADMIPGMVHRALVDKIPDFNEVEVKLVWDPPWDASMMTEEARFALDLY